MKLLFIIFLLLPYSVHLLVRNTCDYEFEGEVTISECRNVDNNDNTLVTLFNDTSKLIIKESHITTIRKELFKFMTEIKILVLNGIHISEIDETAFEDLLLLNEIYLTHNNISEFKYYNAAKLYKLDMSYNKLTNLNLEDINDNLIELYVSNNNITHIQGTNTKKLKILDISYNMLSSLDGIEKLKNLKSLDISNSLISVPDDSFLYINNLEKLSMSNCKMKNLESIKHLNTLKYLNVSHNFLENIQQNDFNSLTLLNTLDLSNNNIKILNSKLFISARNLKTLYLKNNMIESLSNDLFYNSINFIDLSMNKLYDIHLVQVQQTAIVDLNPISTFGHFNETITHIDFTQTLLSGVTKESFKNLKQLSYLNLSMNVITEINVDTFENLHNLKTLSLSKNFISVLHLGTFSNLESLENLDLSFNTLQDFQIGIFADLHNLTQLNLSHNNIKSIDHRIFFPTSKLNTLFLQANPLIPFEIRDLTTHLKNLKSISFEFVKIECSSLHDMLKNGKDMVHRFSFNSRDISISKGNTNAKPNIHGIECDPNEEEDVNFINRMVVCFILIAVLFYIYFIYYTIFWFKKQFQINIIKKNGRSSSVTMLSENEQLYNF